MKPTREQVIARLQELYARRMHWSVAAGYYDGRFDYSVYIEDAVQHANLNILERVDKYKSLRKVNSNWYMYLLRYIGQQYQYALYDARVIKSEQKRQYRHTDASDYPEQFVENLTKIQRRIVEGRQQGETYKQIARRINKTIGYVGTTLYNVKRAYEHYNASEYDPFASDYLSDRDVHIYELRFKHGWHNRRISKHFGLTNRHVASIICVARQKLFKAAAKRAERQKLESAS